MATALSVPAPVSFDVWAKALAPQERGELWAVAKACAMFLDDGNQSMAFKAVGRDYRIEPRMLAEMVEAFPLKRSWLKLSVWDLFQLTVRRRGERRSAHNERRMTAKVWPVEGVHRSARHRKGVTV